MLAIAKCLWEPLLQALFHFNYEHLNLPNGFNLLKSTQIVDFIRYNHVMSTFIIIIIFHILWN
jgi:hypothetical protein